MASAHHTLARPPVVTTLTAAGMGEESGVRIEFIPTSLHCYTIARNVLRMESLNLRNHALPLDTATALSPARSVVF